VQTNYSQHPAKAPGFSPVSTCGFFDLLIADDVVVRADAAFAKPELYEALEKRNVRFAIRIPSNETLGTGRRRVAPAPRGTTQP
jgi:hypothetical protein